MKKIYCDTGGYDKNLKKLEMEGYIQIQQFKYENINRNIKNISKPSNPTFDEINVTFSELIEANITFEALLSHSKMFDEILSIIGSEHKVDAKHLDSAYINQCNCFLTSDKRDIVSKRNELENLLGIKIFHVVHNWHDFVSYIKQC